MPEYILSEWDFPNDVSRKDGCVELTETNAIRILEDAKNSISRYLGQIAVQDVINFMGEKNTRRFYKDNHFYQVDFSELSRFIVRYTEASEGSCSCCTHLRGEQVGDRRDDCAEYCGVHETFDDIGCVYTDKKTGKRTRAYSRSDSPVVAKFRSIVCPDCKPRTGKTLAQIVGEMEKEI